MRIASGRGGVPVSGAHWIVLCLPWWREQAGAVWVTVNFS